MSTGKLLELYVTVEEFVSDIFSPHHGGCIRVRFVDVFGFTRLQFPSILIVIVTACLIR